MALSDTQIARLLLGAFRGSGVNVKEDDIAELEIYVANGYDWLEENHIYDPKQYAVTTSAIAVQHYAAWRFCSIRPDLADLAAFYYNQLEIAEIDWAGQAAEDANIHHNEYPENRTRVSWNNDDPFGDEAFGFHELGT